MGTYQQEYILVMDTYQQEYVLVMGTYILPLDNVLVMGTYMLPRYNVLVMGTYLLPLYKLLKHLGLPICVRSACYRRNIGLLLAYDRLLEYGAYNHL